MEGLTSTQLSGLSTATLLEFSTTQVDALTIGQLHGLSSDQLNALGLTPVD